MLALLKAFLLPALAAAVRTGISLAEQEANVGGHLRELAAFGQDYESWLKAVMKNAATSHEWYNSTNVLLEVEEDSVATALPRSWPTSWGGILGAPKAVGKGAFGKVYVASACGESKVAVKEMKAPQSEVDSEASMLKLFTVGSKYASPNFVQYFDHKKGTSKAWYIMMEAASGGTLQKAVENRVPSELRRLLIADMIEGIAEMHSANLVHRDLKPANVLLSRSCASGLCRAKIADLGMSCWLQKSVPGIPKCRGVGGTPLYMAPELYKNSIISPANDVWALGLMLYELKFQDLPSKIAGSRTMGQLEQNIAKFNIQTDARFVGMPQGEEKELIKDMLDPDYRKRISADSALARIQKLATGRNRDVMTALPSCMGGPAVQPVPAKPKPGQPERETEPDDNADNVDFFTIKSPMTDVSTNFIFKDEIVDPNTGSVLPKIGTVNKAYMPKKLKAGDVILTVNDHPWASLKKNDLLKEQLKQGLFGPLNFMYMSA